MKGLKLLKFEGLGINISKLKIERLKSKYHYAQSSGIIVLIIFLFFFFFKENGKCYKVLAITTIVLM